MAEDRKELEASDDAISAKLMQAEQNLQVIVALIYTVYHPLEGRCFVWFVFDQASLHGPKPKHSKPLPPSE